jgi:two-component system sensor histidine kinase RegB
MMEIAKTLTGNNLNLKRLIHLRFIVTFCEVVALIYAVNELHIHLPWQPISIILGVIILISLLSLIRLRFDKPVSRLELFAQLNLDVLALTVLLYYTGGSTNPFSPLYLLPLTLTASTLPGRYTWIMALITTGYYSLLLFYYIPMQDMHSNHNDGFRLHVFGMWMGFVLSAVLISIFLSRMAETVRRQDKKIADLREQKLRHEQVLALGTLAAGAAHELGTPLSTMAIILNDLNPKQPLTSKSLDILRQQVQRSKNILPSIAAAGGAMRAESGKATTLDQHLNNLIDSWKNSREGLHVTSVIQDSKPAPQAVIDQTLDQALLNIFNNAADASPQQIDISANWDESTLTLEISDRGSGLSAEMITHAGENIQTTKHDGLGLGLFLTYSTIERLGGDVQLFNRKDGGGVCQVNLPLKSLQVTLK